MIRLAMVALCLPLLAMSCESKPPIPDPLPPESTYVVVGGAKLPVQWIRTDPERIGTLASRPALRNLGVLIGYAHDRILHHHTGDGGPECDVAWISKDGRIVEMARLPGGSDEGVTSTSAARYALAAPVGWLAQRGARVGDVVQFSAEIEAFPAEPLPEIKVGGVAVRVEVSEYSYERVRGLMHRRRLSPGDGMLFVYSTLEPHSFWMRNCHFGLDIAYFDDKRTLLNVVPMDPYPNPASDSTPNAPSNGPAQFVLEVNKGWFAANGLVDKEGKPAREITLELPPVVEELRKAADP